MTDTPTTNIDLVRTLIRAVDDQNHNAIATLTSKDVHFRFGSADPTNTQSELRSGCRSVPFVLPLPICTTLSSTCGRSTTVSCSPPWTSTTGDSTIVN